MGEVLREICWRAAAVDSVLLATCPARERRGFALVGALVILQSVLAGSGAFEALLLADGGYHAPLQAAVLAGLAMLIAFFWSAVIRLSLVNMGRGLTTAGARWFRPVPLLLRLGLYGLLGTALAQADVVLAFRALGLLHVPPGAGLLSLLEETGRHSAAVTLAEVVLSLIFVAPVLLRGALPHLANGEYERRHLEQLRRAVVREGRPSARAWAERMARHVGGPAPMPRQLRTEVFFLEAPPEPAA